MCTRIKETHHSNILKQDANGSLLEEMISGLISYMFSYKITFKLEL